MESSSSSETPSTTPETNVLVKCAKGTRDWTPDLMKIREEVFAIVTSIFKRHGATAIDTPVFERKEILMGKYGEDEALIYELEDQGGELLALRYDLTVPFARYLAERGITNLTRYHIGKVYRRDNPVMTKGRFREFYQCDFDIAGAYDLMIPDAHCIRIVSEVLTALPWLGPFTIKLNHRKLLDGIFEHCGVPEDKLRTICSAVDKLDKTPWAAVAEEMVQKGITAEQAESIGKFVRINGTMADTLAFLTNSCPQLLQNASAKQAVAEMELLAGYLEPLEVLPMVSFDLSLARGLSYYTGMIMETVLHDAQVGSIAGGGRYDDLVGMFSRKQVPSVGFSIGIERILAAVKDKLPESKGKYTEVVVCTAGLAAPLSVQTRFHILDQLWKQGIAAELVYKDTPNPRTQLSYASSIDAKWSIIVGDRELVDNVVQLKNMEQKISTALPLAEAIEAIIAARN